MIVTSAAKERCKPCNGVGLLTIETYGINDTEMRWIPVLHGECELIAALGAYRVPKKRCTPKKTATCSNCSCKT